MFYTKKPQGLILRLKITPNSSKSELILPTQNEEWARLKIAAVPEKGKANKAIIEFLSKYFAVRKSEITITSGETSSLKTILISGDANSLEKSLNKK